MKTYRPLPSSSLVQCCSQVVVTGFAAPTGVAVVDVIFVVSSQLKDKKYLEKYSIDYLKDLLVKSIKTIKDLFTLFTCNITWCWIVVIQNIG